MSDKRLITDLSKNQSTMLSNVVESYSGESNAGLAGVELLPLLKPSKGSNNLFGYHDRRSASRAHRLVRDF
jgi:hypothetical protein